MINNVLFISENELKQNSIVQQNVDTQLLTPFIKTAQDIYIEPFLGVALTEELKDAVISGVITGNTEIILVKYIAPAMIYFTLYEAAPFSVIKWTNKALTKKGSENSTVIDNVELVEFRKGIKNTAENYMYIMKKWLENEKPFASYYNDVDCDTNSSRNKLFYGGIQF
jgi:hypothetical protein